MANTKRITRPVTLEILADFYMEHNPDPDFEVLACAGKMYKTVQPKPKAAVAKTQARKDNEDFAEWVFNNAKSDIITTTDVVALGHPKITSTQKASAVLRVGVEMGYFTCEVNKKKRPEYHKVPED